MAIYAHEIDEMIKKLEAAGAKVTIDTHAIYCASNVSFNEDVYPLEVITDFGLPEGVAFIIAKRPDGEK